MFQLHVQYFARFVAARTTAVIIGIYLVGHVKRRQFFSAEEPSLYQFLNAILVSEHLKLLSIHVRIDLNLV